MWRVAEAQRILAQTAGTPTLPPLLGLGPRGPVRPKMMKTRSGSRYAVFPNTSANPLPRRHIPNNANRRQEIRAEMPTLCAIAESVANSPAMEE